MVHELVRERNAKIIYWHFVKKWKPDPIAIRLGIGASTVRQAISDFRSKQKSRHLRRRKADTLIIE